MRNSEVIFHTVFSFCTIQRQKKQVTLSEGVRRHEKKSPANYTLDMTEIYKRLDINLKKYRIIIALT